MEIEITRTVALISINATIFAQLISFLIFMMLISRLLYHPIQDVMAERGRKIEQMKKECETAEADLKDIVSKVEVETRRVKDEAFVIQRGLEKNAVIEADELFAGVHAEIAKLDQETQKEVQRQIENARQHLAAESERLSRTIMEKALDRRMSYE